MKQNKTAMGILLAALLFSAFIILIDITKADPEGASITYVSNSTKNASSPGSRTDAKGTITTILLTTIQQNTKWKAYVGNVSGTLVLRDAEEYSIYQWPQGGSPDGEVYLTRNSTLDWSTVQCANETPIENEEVSLGHTTTATDNINNTFSSRLHESIVTGVTTIANSTCKSTVTWFNNTAQTITQNSSTYFPEVLLMDSSLRIIYTTIIDQNVLGYRNDTRFDFQSIVPDFTTSSTATYYFYVEISG
jgi:hypothetical protein